MELYIFDVLENIGFFIPAFQKGLITGMILVLIILIILKLIFMILGFGNFGRCNEVYTKGPNGKLFVSVYAIRDIVKSLETEFKAINIKKTFLYRKHSKYTIRIKANLNDGCVTNVVALVPDFQAKVINILSTNMGVNNISAVDLYIKHAR